MTPFKHCDDYIDDETQPKCLRAFLDHVRSPAHGALRDEARPALFADFCGERVRVVMASRFGDVGITSNLQAEHGYEKRVAVADLSGFSATPSGHAPDCEWHCDQNPQECTCGLAAQAMSAREGHDPQGHGAKPASAVGAADAPDTSPDPSHEGGKDEPRG